jgi:hypothetical protein
MVGSEHEHHDACLAPKTHQITSASRSVTIGITVCPITPIDRARLIEERENVAPSIRYRVPWFESEAVAHSMEREIGAMRILKAPKRWC